MNFTGDISQRPEYKWTVLTMSGLKIIFPPAPDILASQTSYLSGRTWEILPTLHCQPDCHSADLTPPVDQSDWVRGDLWGRRGGPAGRGSRGRLGRGNVCEPRSSCCGRQAGVSPAHPRLCSSRRATFWKEERRVKIVRAGTLNKHGIVRLHHQDVGCTANWEDIKDLLSLRLLDC